MDALQALAAPRRREMMRLLWSRELSAGELRLAMADVTFGAVSQHLRALREAKLVAERRDGRHVLYRVTPNGLAPLIDWLGHYQAFWNERFENLEKLLKETE